jgi:hypothetical protein
MDLFGYAGLYFFVFCFLFFVLLFFGIFLLFFVIFCPEIECLITLKLIFYIRSWADGSLRRKQIRSSPGGVMATLFSLYL